MSGSKELTLKESLSFWGEIGKNISAYEKFKVLSVTGGIPRYLEEVRPDLSAEENLKQLCFTKEGFLFNEFDQIFSDIFITRSKFYRKVVLSLKDRNLEPLELCKSIKAPQNDTTSDYLDELVQAGFLARDYSWHLKTGEVSKLSHYRIKDNYLRFYLKYIYPNQHQILSGAFQESSLSMLPNWEGIMGLQFKNLILNNRKNIWKLLSVSPDEIIWNNPYFQRKTNQQEGCQIDYLIQTKFNTLYVCEIKFSKHPIKKEVVSEMEKKLKNLKLPRHVSYRPVLIHVNGVHEEVIESGYFSNIIDFNEFLEAY